MADVTSLIDVRTSDRFGTCRIWKKMKILSESTHLKNTWPWRWQHYDPAYAGNYVPNKTVSQPRWLVAFSNTNVGGTQLLISHDSSAFFIYAKIMNSSPHKWLPFVSTCTLSNNNLISFTSYALWYICHWCTAHLITRAMQWKIKAT